MNYRRGRSHYADLECAVSSKTVVSSDEEVMSDGDSWSSAAAAVDWDLELAELIDQAFPPVVLPPPSVVVPDTGKTRALRWCLTLSSKAGLPLVGPWTRLPIGCRYLVFQAEIGSQGTSHYQAYCEFSTRTSLAKVKEVFGFDYLHCEWAHSAAQINKEYCTKCCDTCYAIRKKAGFIGPPGSDCATCARLAGPWTFGEPVTQGIRAAVFEDIREHGLISVLRSNPAGVSSCGRIAEKFDSVIRSDTRKALGYYPPEIRLFTGPSECGKSKYAWALDPGLYPLFSHGQQGVWFDGYCGEPTVLIEEFHSSIPLTQLLQFLDGYIVRLPVKFGSDISNVRTWILATNVEPFDWYLGCPEPQRLSLFNRIYHRFGLHLRFHAVSRQFERVSSQYDSSGLSPEQVRQLRQVYDPSGVRVVRDAWSLSRPSVAFRSSPASQSHSRPPWTDRPDYHASPSVDSGTQGL